MVGPMNGKSQWDQRLVVVGRKIRGGGQRNNRAVYY